MREEVTKRMCVQYRSLPSRWTRYYRYSGEHTNDLNLCFNTCSVPGHVSSMLCFLLPRVGHSAAAAHAYR